MNVLMVEPGKAPYVTDIGNDLRSMQQADVEMEVNRIVQNSRKADSEE